MASAPPPGGPELKKPWGQPWIPTPLPSLPLQQWGDLVAVNWSETFGGGGMWATTISLTPARDALAEVALSGVRYWTWINSGKSGFLEHRARAWISEVESAQGVEQFEPPSEFWGANHVFRKGMKRITFAILTVVPPEYHAHESDGMAHGRYLLYWRS